MKSCKKLRAQLMECVVQSECFRRGDSTPQQCVAQLSDPHCVAIRQALRECKRGQMDMRKRFRGVPGE